MDNLQPQRQPQTTNNYITRIPYQFVHSHRRVLPGNQPWSTSSLTNSKLLSTFTESERRQPCCAESSRIEAPYENSADSVSLLTLKDTSQRMLPFTILLIFVENFIAKTVTILFELSWVKSLYSYLYDFVCLAGVSLFRTHVSWYFLSPEPEK